MKITMVQKRMAEGSPYRKCEQVSELLERRGHLADIHETVSAHEGVPGSEGMRLAEKHGIDTAPFFIVSTEDDDDGDGDVMIYTSALKMRRDCFDYKASLIEELEEKTKGD